MSKAIGSVVGKIKRRPARKREEWILLVEEAAISGESVQEFCARHNVTEYSLYKWRQRLNSKDGTRKKALFIPVRVRPEVAMRSASSQISARFFMHGSGGIRVEFPSGCTGAELKLVAGVLSC